MPRRRGPASGALPGLVIAVILGAGAAGLPAAVHADGSAQQAKPPADDADLMEFLGSIGSVDERWIDYLARTDPATVAPAAKPPAPSGGDSSGGESDGSQKK